MSDAARSVHMVTYRDRWQRMSTYPVTHGARARTFPLRALDVDPNLPQRWLQSQFRRMSDTGSTGTATVHLDRHSTPDAVRVWWEPDRAAHQ